jgi:hypothetical protein
MCFASPREELAITRSERWMDFHTLRMQGLSIRKIAALRGVSGNGLVARGVLADSCGIAGAASTALGWPPRSS